MLVTMQTESSCQSYHHIRLRAMNTTIELIYLSSDDKASGIGKIAADWFGKTERRFSRFREDSELSSLNKQAGQRCFVSDAMLEVLLLTNSYGKATDGVFEPLIKKALEQSGYNQSFEKLGQECGTAEFGDSVPVSKQSQPLLIDPVMKSVVLPGQIDLGGIVKSWSVQRLASYLQHKLGIKEGLINAGGDLTVWGRAAEPLLPWLIGIENPWDEATDIGTLALSEGAVATSSKLRRQWLTGQGLNHHLIDPRTMNPSSSDIVQCTVAGPNVVECEVWAKTLCILGAHEGLAFFSRKTTNYEALLFTSGRQTHFYGSQSSIGRLWREVRIDEQHWAE